MATRLFKYSPNKAYFEITQGVGSAVASDPVELTIELAATVNEGSTTRTISKEEVILGLEKMIQYIHEQSWPPA